MVHEGRAEKLTRYNNPKVEQLIAMLASRDPKVRQAKYEELQKIIWAEEEATIWPYYSVAVYGVRDRIGGYEAGRLRPTLGRERRLIDSHSSGTLMRATRRRSGGAAFTAPASPCLD